MTLKWNGAKYIKAVAEGTQKGLTLSAIVVQGQAKLDCPVDEDNLRSSIAYEIEVNDAKVGTNVHYGPHIEYGTSKMQAQPYLRPALDSNKTNIRKLVADSIASAIKRG